MMNSAKIEKLINDLIAAVNSVKEEDFVQIKDDKLGKLYFTTDTLINSFDNFIDKIDAEIIKRNEIVIPDLGQKIVKEDEPVLKIKKLSKAEIKAAQAPAVKAPAAQAPAVKAPAVKAPAVKAPAVKAPAAKAPAAKAPAAKAPAAKAPAAKKPAAPKKA